MARCEEIFSYVGDVVRDSIEGVTFLQCKHPGNLYAGWIDACVRQMTGGPTITMASLGAKTINV